MQKRQCQRRQKARDTESLGEACRVGDFPLGFKARGEGPGDEPGCVLGGGLKGMTGL